MKNKILILLLLAAVALLSALPRELVIVEIATGTWCGYCPGAAMGAHDLVANGHAVAIVKNHNGDNYANTYSNARNSYYGANSFPTAFFDGGNASVGGSANQSLYSNYLPKVNARLNVPSHYTIDGSGTLSGNTLDLSVLVSKPEADTNTNVVLHASATQSNIPHNWGNQTTVDNVNRLMAPNASGTPINLSTGESITANLSLTLNPAWNYEQDDIEIVLWLQNVSSKEILQGVKYSLAEISGGFPVNTDNVNFGSIYVSGTVSRDLVFRNYSSELVNATLSIDNPVFSANLAEITIPAMQAQLVSLSFEPTAAGQYDGILLVTGNFENHPELEITLSGTGFVNTEPVAYNVQIEGLPLFMQLLEGSYSYFDADGDAEGNTILQWHRMVGSQLVAIDGANTDRYNPQVEDLDCEIYFGVTPYDSHGMPGDTIFSEPIGPIEPLPAPANFAAELVPPDTVVLTWERPPHFSRGFSGYRLFRNGLNISTITNPNTLQFTDTYVPEGTYEYWICSLFTNPMLLSDPSPSVFITIGESANEDLVQTPDFAALISPNPFKGDAELLIKSAPNSDVTFSVFNLKGQMLQSWKLKADALGESTRHLSGLNLESGVYFYRLESAGKNLNGKFVKMK